MKKLELSILTGLILAAILSQFGAFAATCDEIRGDTLRLHILANSDTTADQNIKLQVRDAILEEYGTVFSAASSKENAKECATASLYGMRKIAEDVLLQNGCPAAAQVKLERLYFDTKEYESFTMPAGMYDAVRVELGTAAGHNWFCVMYPPLCLPAASENNTMAVFSADEKRVLKRGYTVKFAALEWLERQKAIGQ
ncbi:MAG: stage II sporulation protein R [Ruthenibacterium sp.]